MSTVVESNSILFHGGNLFTGTDGEIRPDWAVLTSGSLISAVGPSSEILAMAENAIKIDLRGRTLLPGLIDAHRHIIGQNVVDVTPKLVAEAAIVGVRVAWETLEDGITTVRDPGCKHDAIYVLRDAINQGIVPGPTIYAAGQNPTGHSAPQHWRNVYVDGPWAMRRAVRELVRDGADWIKLIIGEATEASDYRFFARFLTDEEISAAIEETHALGRRISCHVEGLKDARYVVDAGMDAIEHGFALDQPLVDQMARAGVCYVPTLWVFQNDMESGAIPEPRRTAYQRLLDQHDESFRLALAAGVTIAVGTDSVDDIPPRDCYLVEMTYMLENGMSRVDVLRAATMGGARVLGIHDHVGSLSTGLLADLIAVRGDPLQDLNALGHVELVVKRGRTIINRLPDNQP